MSQTLTVPNIITGLRAPLLLLLFSESVPIRCCAIIMAALSDFLDGFIARKFNLQSHIGKHLDPIMDKVFVATALFVFTYEGVFSVMNLLAFFSRDISLFVYWIQEKIRGKEVIVRSIWSGKLATTIQFFILILASLAKDVPESMYFLMAFFGIASYFELVFSRAAR